MLHKKQLMKLKINLPTVFLLIDIKNGLEKRDQKIVTILIPLINENKFLSLCSY